MTQSNTFMFVQNARASLPLTGTQSYVRTANECWGFNDNNRNRRSHLSVHCREKDIVREIIQPKDETHWLQLRMKDLTSTEISALFGLSPYTTEFELWHRKKQESVVEFRSNERMVWGSRLEAAIAKGVASDHGWNIRRMDEYIRIPDLRIGSSFDFSIDENALLEIKNVDALQFQQSWVENEAPPHIEMQVQHQLLVSGREHAFLCALVGGNRIVTIERKPNEKIHEAIKLRAKDFWASIDSSKPPSPDFTRDAEFIAKLYGYADPGKVYNGPHIGSIGELAKKYRELGAQEKEIKSQRETAKAQILTIIGDAEKTIGDSFTISAGMVGPCKVAYEREGYRAFKISWKKEKP